MATSTQDGMGARFYGAGTGFRVWAPNAQSVAVTGDFNQWSKTANPLTSEGNGYWSTDVIGATEGQTYQYVINNSFQKNDPYARELRVSGLNTLNTVIHESEINGPNFDWDGDDFQMPAWNELVVYELHIGTFAVESGGESKFEAAASKLEHLQKLGINAIEIMAAGEFATDTSWGYNTAFLFAIESSYGGIKGFKSFVKAAHAHGIAVIFDVVYNHLGPQGLDLWQFDGWSENNQGGIYFYNDWRYWTPWGSRPDYGRNEVRQYLRDNALMWLQKRHVDGLRWDATVFIRNAYGKSYEPQYDIAEGWSLMQWINNEIYDRQPWKIVIAEDLQNNDYITRDPAEGGAGCDSQWDAGFVNVVRRAATAVNDAERDIESLRGVINSGNAFKRVIYTESHDEVAHREDVQKWRLPEDIWRGNADSWAAKKRSTLAAGLVFTSPGIPMIFQGQEFLEWGQWDDKNNLDWAKATRFEGIYNLYRDMIRLRRNWFDSTRGLKGQQVNVHHVNNADKLLAFHRWANGGNRDDVVVVANFSDRSYSNYTLGFPRSGLWKVRLNSDSRAYSPDFGDFFSYDTEAHPTPRDGMPCEANIGIGPYTLLIFSQD